MTCLLKRALPLVIGLAVGIFLVFLFRTTSRLTPPQPAFSGEFHKLDIPPIAPPNLTRHEIEEITRHKRVGLCYSHGPSTQVMETVTDSQVTTKAKILYMPLPNSWEKQQPCTSCLVVMRATLDASGMVTNIVPMSSESYGESVDAGAQCKKDVLAAVQQIRFEPAIKNGKPVSQLVTIIYDKWGHGAEVQ